MPTAKLACLLQEVITNYGFHRHIYNPIGIKIKKMIELGVPKIAIFVAEVYAN